MNLCTVGCVIATQQLCELMFTFLIDFRLYFMPSISIWSILVVPSVEKNGNHHHLHSHALNPKRIPISFFRPFLYISVRYIPSFTNNLGKFTMKLDMTCSLYTHKINTVVESLLYNSYH